MTIYVRDDGWTLVAHSHIWRGVELMGKELRVPYLQSIEEGEMELDFQGNRLRIPVEKLMFDKRDTVNSSRY